jgi:hypothetical protein
VQERHRCKANLGERQIRGGRMKNTRQADRLMASEIKSVQKRRAYGTDD